jgi:hypothetical protein
MEDTELDFKWAEFKKRLSIKYPVRMELTSDAKIKADARLHEFLSKNREDVIKDIDEWLSLMD